MNSGSLNGYSVNARGLRGGAFRVAADLVGKAFVSVKARVYRYLSGSMVLHAEIGPGVGRRGVRSPLQTLAQAAVAITAIPLRRDTFAATCQAVVQASVRAGRRAIVGFNMPAVIDLSGYVLHRGTADLYGSVVLPADLTSFRQSPQPLSVRAQVTLRAGVLNEFTYDEDAPEERVFLVAPEDNVFYVVV